MTSYNYNVLTDFPNGKVNPTRLQSELLALTFSWALDRIDVVGNTCTIVFRGELSNTEKGYLDGAVANHSGLKSEEVAQPVTLSSPKTADGKPIFLPNLFPGNVFVYITGCGDSSDTVGAGTSFMDSSVLAGTSTTEFQFRDWVYIAGGTLFTSQAIYGDKISMGLYAPASTISVNANNTGDCNLVALGGGKNMIVPASGNGTHNLVSGIPVPSYDEGNGETPDGYWNWSNPDTGLGTLSPSSGTGAYNLFDFQVDLVNFLKSIPILGTNGIEISIPAIKPKKVLPHWKFKVSLVNSGNVNLKVCWYLVTARRTTL